MPRPEKVETVAELREKLGRSRGALLADYRGLDVAQIGELRRRLKGAGVEYRVVRNNLFRLAAHEVGAAGLDPFLEGPVSVAFAYQDPVAAAKVFSAFMREFKLPTVKGAWVEGSILDAEGVRQLAELPGRDVLLGQVLGGMSAPLTGAVSCLAGLLRGLAYALDGLRKQKEGIESV